MRSTAPTTRTCVEGPKRGKDRIDSHSENPGIPVGGLVEVLTLIAGQEIAVSSRICHGRSGRYRMGYAVRLTRLASRSKRRAPDKCGVSGGGQRGWPHLDRDR